MAQIFSVNSLRVIATSIRAAHQKIQQMISNLVVPRVVEDGLAGAIARKRIAKHFGDPRPRAIAHQEDSISKQDCLVHVVGDEEDRLVRRRPDLQQVVLNQPSGERVERAKWLIEQQHLRLDGEGASDAHPLLHSPRQLGRLLVL